MKIGYARVSTVDQNLDLQKDALTKAGCERIITDEISGSVITRPGLEKLKDIVRFGDTIIVWRMDRLGCSLKHLIEWVSYFEEHGIAFHSLEENIDTGSASGRLIFHVFGALAEFERQLIRERTQAGLKAARARGRLGGRPKKLSDEKWQLALKLYKEQEKTVDEICRLVGVSRPTFYKYLKKR